MKLKTAILLVFFYSLFTNIYAQNEQFLLCRVVDSETKVSIPFVTVVIPQKGLGVIANAEGDFRIRRNSVAESDSVVFTCIGYNKKIEFIRNIKSGIVNEITLSQGMVEIGEVKIKAKKKRTNSKIIVRNALRNISTNCPQRPFNNVGYYRDYQKFNGKYLNLNEAIIENKDKGFNKDISTSRFKLLSFRENDKFKRIDLPITYNDGTKAVEERKLIPGATLDSHGGNELWILLAHDAIRRKHQFAFSFVDTLLKDFIVHHKFEDFETVYNDTLPLYKIHFSSRDLVTSDTIFAKGTIFIEPENYAIHKLDYSVFYQKKHRPIQQMFNVSLEYGRVQILESRMALKYISFNNLFQALDPEDKSQFKVIEQGFEPDKLKAVFVFNRNVNAKTAYKKRNYYMSFGGVQAQIKNIIVQKNRVYVYLRKGKYDFEKGYYKLSNIADVNGKVVDQKSMMEVYQFRELFVQDYFSAIKTRKNCYMQNLPLSENCINQIIGKNKYWMNSPLADEEK